VALGLSPKVNPGGEAEVVAAVIDCDKENADEGAKGEAAKALEAAPNWEIPGVIPNAGIAVLLPPIRELVPKLADATATLEVRELIFRNYTSRNINLLTNTRLNLVESLLIRQRTPKSPLYNLKM